MNHAVDQTLIYLWGRLTKINDKPIIAQSVLMAHYVVALFVQVPMHRPHASEIFRLTDKLLTLQFLLSLPREDRFKDTLDIFPVSDLINQRIDVALSRIAIQLTLKIAEFAISLPDHSLVDFRQLGVFLLHRLIIFIDSCRRCEKLLLIIQVLVVLVLREGDLGFGSQSFIFKLLLFEKELIHIILLIPTFF